MTNVYNGNWESAGDMAQSFSIDEPELAGKTVLFAAYEYGLYEGYAFVLLVDNASGQFEEVNGCHCSCCGLEGQWEPEQCDPDALMHRLTNGSTYGVMERYKDQIAAVLAGQ